MVMLPNMAMLTSGAVSNLGSTLPSHCGYVVRSPREADQMYLALAISSRLTPGLGYTSLE